MNTQELQKLKEQIATSTLLSQIEKTEWMQLLLEMNDTQAIELQSILQSAVHNVTSPVAAVAPVIAPPLAPIPIVSKPVFQEEKELPAQPEEKTLPPGIQIAGLEQVIKAVTPKPVPPAPKPAAPTVHERPAWQAKIVEHPEVHQEVQKPVVVPPAPKVTPTSKPVVSIPTVPPAPVPATKHVFVPEKTEPIKNPSLPTVQTPEDLVKLNLPFIHQSDPQLVLNNLLRAVTAMTKKFPVTELIGKIEQSPLYKAYYNTGLSALNSGALSNNTQAEILNREEFEAFTDFRREMEKALS